MKATVLSLVDWFALQGKNCSWPLLIWWGHKGQQGAEIQMKGTGLFSLPVYNICHDLQKMNPAAAVCSQSLFSLHKLLLLCTVMHHGALFITSHVHPVVHQVSQGFRSVSSTSFMVFEVWTVVGCKCHSCHSSGFTEPIWLFHVSSSYTLCWKL